MRIPLVALACACSSIACIGLPPPPPEGRGSSSSTTELSTTATVPGDESTQGGTTLGTTTLGTTTMGVAETTTGSSSSSGTTTSSVVSTGSSSSGVPPECQNPGDCGSNETCAPGGQCVPACEPWGDGDYGYCLTPLGTYNSEVLCGEALACINSGNPTEVVVCGRTCATQCDCPEPPPTGDATVTCGGIVGGGDRCYLSCASGETCPDDMVCRDGTYCAHPVQPLEMYGNCDDIAAPCIDGVCATSGSHSVCVSACPGGIGDCDPAPAGASLGFACIGVISPPAGFDCHVACNGNGDCPSGMECINAGGSAPLCMWP